MKRFLRKIKLITDFSTNVHIQKHEFVRKFKQHVDEKSVGLFSDAFDIFSSSKNEYKGRVEIDGFKIKRKRKLFDTGLNLSVAQGSYKQEGETLTIEAEINGFSGAMIPFYLFAIVFYSVFIALLLTGDHEESPISFLLPFVLFHAAFMFGIPYYMMRSSVEKMKHDLEREFYYMTKE